MVTVVTMVVGEGRPDVTPDPATEVVGIGRLVTMVGTTEVGTAVVGTTEVMVVGVPKMVDVIITVEQ